MATGIYGMDRQGPGYAGGGSGGKSFVSTVLARTPFSYQIIDKITELNPKYELFSKLAADRQTKLQAQSILTGGLQQQEANAFGSVFLNQQYHQLMYANVETDKIRRLQDYRRMAAYAEMANCIDEICDECIVEDENEKVLKLKINSGVYSKLIEDEIEKEFDTFSGIYDLNHKGWNYFHNLIVDGELFFENIVSKNRPEFGIIGVGLLPSELINPIYDNVQNDRIRGFLLRRPKINPKSQMVESEENIILAKDQVTYVNSGLWNEDKTVRLPFIENARRAYKLLSLIEDSIIIHRLVRAPERLVFKIDVGNLSPPKAEEYIRRMAHQFWNRKTYDVSSGRITNIHEAQSYLDSYFFPKRAGTEGTTVENIQGSQGFGSIDDLMYFVKKLYDSMKVPKNRLDPNNQHSDGMEMSREELRFARFIIRVQQNFALGIKNAFMAHLKLRNIAKVYEVKESDISIRFNTPTLFMQLKQNQIFQLKYENFNNMSQNEGISNSFAQERYLGLTPEEMARNREWSRKDAAFQYELEQIKASGPNWKEQLAGTTAALEGAAEAGGGGGAPPSFGPPPGGAEAPEGGEDAPPAGGEAPPAGGAEAPPAAGAPPPAGETAPPPA